MDPSRFNTASIRAHPHGDAVTRVLAAALDAVDPGIAVRRFLQRQDNRLVVSGFRGQPPVEYRLEQYRRVFLVGAGKAGAPMAEAAVDILGGVLTAGILIVKEGYAGDARLPENITILEAGHPIPDERGQRGTRHILDLLTGTQPDDLVLCLISGGGSALLTAPVPGITLGDLQSLTADLLASGASIADINVLRKHLDTVKGGGLAAQAAPARLVSLILSDVVGDLLDTIASGPTVPDPSTFADAVQILRRFALVEKVPSAVLDHLLAGVDGKLPETPKPGDPVFQQVNNVVIGSNLQAAQAALEQAQAEGFHSLLLTTYLQGEARQAGRTLAAVARQIAATGQPLDRPGCLIAGGETTVAIQGDGLGGRNQEIALSATMELAGLPDLMLVTLATDGGDGPTDAAGAVVTGETLHRARRAGLDPARFLSRNDSYHFFDALADLLRPGPTQTNVNDLAFLFAF